MSIVNEFIKLRTLFEELAPTTRRGNYTKNRVLALDYIRRIENILQNPTKNRLDKEIKNLSYISENKKLFKRKVNKKVADSFVHEQIIYNKGTKEIAHLPTLSRPFDKEKIADENLTDMKDFKLENIRILDEITGDRRVALNIIANIYVDFYDEDPEEESSRVYRTVNVNEYFNLFKDSTDQFYVKDIKESITKAVLNYLKGFNTAIYTWGYNGDPIISSYYNPADKFKLIDMVLRDVQPLNINNIFNEQIEENNYLHCVLDYLKKLYPKISKKIIDEFFKDLETNTENIYAFCSKYRIRMRAYDINGKCLKSNDPEQKLKYKNLIFIAYNNHLYPLQNMYLHKQKTDDAKLEIELVECGMNKLKEFLRNNILPRNVKQSRFSEGKDSLLDILSFEVGGKKYICNDQYVKCKELLKIFGLEDKIYDGIRFRNLLNVIEPLYTKNKCMSFFPQCSKLLKPAFNYLAKNIDNSRDKITQDKNKCYTAVLAMLKKLISVDYRKCKINEFKTREERKNAILNIRPYNLYIAKPDYHSLLMPNMECYTGECLIFCKNEKLKFEIIEEMECESNDNHFTKMVHDTFTNIDFKDHKIVKDMWVRFIGTMEQDKEIKHTYKITKIANKDESDASSGFVNKICNGYNAIIEKDTHFNIYNRKPINIQIKDQSRIIVYERLKKMGLNNKDVVQIKTDSITVYKNDDINYDFDIDPKNYKCWKYEKYKPMKKQHKIKMNKNQTFKLNGIHNENKISDDYAGCGKTYYIMNTVIPDIKKDDWHDGFIVVTPSWDTIIEYKKNNINCAVTQTYSLSNTIPSEKIIIVDEVGLLDRRDNDLLYKCFLAGKKIYSFGDYRQLFPVMEHSTFNNQYYIKYIYGGQIELKHNHRNNLTKEYYDSLINSSDVNFLKNEIIKMGTKEYTDADCIIAWRIKTVDKYNKLMLEKNGFDSMINVGVNIICSSDANKRITNVETDKQCKLRSLGIFKRFCFNITNVEKNIVTLDNDLQMTKLDVMKHFKPSYARTAYGTQGKTVKSYYYAPEDYWFLNPRLAYTVISRIKQEKIKKQVEIKLVENIDKDENDIILDFDLN